MGIYFKTFLFRHVGTCIQDAVDVAHVLVPNLLVQDHVTVPGSVVGPAAVNVNVVVAVVVEVVEAEAAVVMNDPRTVKDAIK